LWSGSLTVESQNLEIASVNLRNTKLWFL
jgi:hypothetical protein